MGKLLEELVELQYNPAETIQKEFQIESIHGVRVGKLTSVKETGYLLVDYPDNPFGPLLARSTVDIALEDEKRSVLLAFEENDPRLPIIIGLIQEPPVILKETVTLDKKDINDIIVDGERIVFDAEKEIELRCGKSSLIMKRDGKVVIKGTELVSRASGVNKIKGAAVQIN
jgi:hypothetical protein